MDFGGGDHKRQTRSAHGRSSQAKVYGRRIGLRPRLFARSVCDVQRRCSCRLWRYAGVTIDFTITFTPGDQNTGFLRIRWVPWVRRFPTWDWSVHRAPPWPREPCPSAGFERQPISSPCRATDRVRAADPTGESTAAASCILAQNTTAHSRINTIQYNKCFSAQSKGKERNADLYSAYRQYNSTTKRSDVDHTQLPANTPHLPFLRISIR